MGRSVWPLVLRGVVAILFGVAAVLWPGITLLALALLFGVYVLVEGVVALVGAFRERLSGGRRVARVLVGVLGVAAGVLTLAWPRATALVLVVLIGAWALITGALDIVAATRLPSHWPLLVLGVASMVAGALILIRPFAGAFAVAVVIGCYAIVAGALRLAEAWQVHREHQSRTWAAPA
jgi:uncharacterized membrane protein HdeD (DUF308 family)